MIQIGPKVIQNRPKVIQIKGKVIRPLRCMPLLLGTKKAHSVLNEWGFRHVSALLIGSVL